MAEDLQRLRAQLSSLQSLLTLSKLMSDSGEPRRIVELAGTAVPSLARCRLVGVELTGVGWELVGPADGSAAALREVTVQLERLGRSGGAVEWSATVSGWVWAYPMQSSAGHASFLVVAAAAEPPAEERSCCNISLTCHAGEDDRIRIAVTDTGPGIPADKLPRLFTQFDRLGAEHSEVQGTGMGLVLAKRLVEAMGGALTVDSVEGQGTTFTLELSLAMEPA